LEIGPENFFENKNRLDGFCLTPPGRVMRVTTMTPMTTVTNLNIPQLELGLDGSPQSPRLARRERRLARAAWWFSKMRAVVNAAECPSGPGPRPEQTLLPGAYRQIRI
jgi:hypothetical protein